MKFLINEASCHFSPTKHLGSSQVQMCGGACGKCSTRQIKEKPQWFRWSIDSLLGFYWGRGMRSPRHGDGHQSKEDAATVPMKTAQPLSKKVKQVFGTSQLIVCTVDDVSFNQKNIQVPVFLLFLCNTHLWPNIWSVMLQSSLFGVNQNLAIPQQS